ncbi:MAG: acylneuraminate cytidylyltransferase family protein [Desulfovibrionaceae bacterium]|nr:acylneuraminate cytidylyltransferase family protein [Desulfovibrionaceae bacterium]MBF0512665.1 acylneuraminate cytidylyltransferase family protein [Desulfovibrionaceae bacterium]
MEVLAIVPARGGSKGVPGKNIRPLCGKPLIAYTIEAAILSGCINRLVVSTDDREIAAISRECGAEVPFLRPKGLATDCALLSDAVGHVEKSLAAQGYRPDAVLVMFPTHPFRTPALIRALTGKLGQGYSHVSSVVRRVHDPSSVFSARNGNLAPLLDRPGLSRKHPGKTYYRATGLLQGGLLAPATENKTYLHVVEDPVYDVDIDTFEDFYLAEEIIRGGLFDFTGGPSR